MRHGDAQKGFSLLELLVASAIFFAFMVGMVTLFTQSHRAFARGQNQVQVQQSARIAMHAMAREIRIAGYDPSFAIQDLGTAAAVQFASDNLLTLIADVDGDGVTDRVTYRLQGEDLVREFASWQGSGFSSDDSSQLAEGIATLRFTYYDGSSAGGGTIATPVAPAGLPTIRRVTVDLVAAQLGVNAEERFPLSLDVSLRNPLAADAAAKGAAP